MRSVVIKQIQNKVISLLRQKRLPLHLLAKDNCSELSRLVGCWLLKKDPNINIFIAKGSNVFRRKNKSHDVVLVKSDNVVYVIDPTVWQFFKYKKTY